MNEVQSQGAGVLGAEQSTMYPLTDARRTVVLLEYRYERQNNQAGGCCWLSAVLNRKQYFCFPLVENIDSRKRISHGYDP